MTHHPCLLLSPDPCYNEDSRNADFSRFEQPHCRYPYDAPRTAVKEDCQDGVAGCGVRASMSFQPSARRPEPWVMCRRRVEYHMAKQRQEFAERPAGPAQETDGGAFAGQPDEYSRSKNQIRIDGSGLRLHKGRRDCLPASVVQQDYEGADLYLRPLADDPGKKVGDVATIVTPNGKRQLEEILKLTTVHDEAGDDENEAESGRAQQGLRTGSCKEDCTLSGQAPLAVPADGFRTTWWPMGWRSPASRPMCSPLLGSS